MPTAKPKEFPMVSMGRGPISVLSTCSRPVGLAPLRCTGAYHNIRSSMRLAPQRVASQASTVNFN